MTLKIIASWLGIMGLVLIAYSACLKGAGLEAGMLLIWIAVQPTVTRISKDYEDGRI